MMNLFLPSRAFSAARGRAMLNLERILEARCSCLGEAMWRSATIHTESLSRC